MHEPTTVEPMISPEERERINSHSSLRTTKSWDELPDLRVSLASTASSEWTNEAGGPVEGPKSISKDLESIQREKEELRKYQRLLTTPISDPYPFSVLRKSRSLPIIEVSERNISPASKSSSFHVEPLTAFLSTIDEVEEDDVQPRKV